jgi:tight adherence protein B
MSRWLTVGGGTYGVFLLVTALGMGWSGLGPGPLRGRHGRRGLDERLRCWMVEVGLGDVSLAELVRTSALVGCAGGLLAGSVFGGVVPPAAVGSFAATLPAAAYRRRRAARQAVAEEQWPAMIEELRVLTGSAGRSIPQALFEVGSRSPELLRPAFTAAHREWLLTTDLARSLEVLTARLASPTADALCETLLVAHGLGATDLDRRLAEFAEDRRQDAQARKEARARQAGVRFARRFVVLVPAGMAAAGMSLGRGREAYATASGQVLVSVGVLLVVACWVWSGAMLRLPKGERVSA